LLVHKVLTTLNSTNSLVIIATPADIETLGTSLWREFCRLALDASTNQLQLRVVRLAATAVEKEPLVWNDATVKLALATTLSATLVSRDSIALTQRVAANDGLSVPDAIAELIDTGGIEFRDGEIQSSETRSRSDLLRPRAIPLPDPV